MKNSHHISLIDVNQLFDYMRLGIIEDRLPTVQQAFDNWCVSNNITSLEHVKHCIQSDEVLYQSLIDVLTVAETYFFRHSGHFEYIRQEILPNLDNLNRPLQIFSAGCATGEEAYSLAMLLHAEMPNIQFRILACDISKANILAAKKGIYTDWSLRNKASWPQMENYFTFLGDGKYQLKSVIKDKVSFLCCNLLDNFIQHANLLRHSFDLIFCRNMMIYINNIEAKKLTDNLISLLQPQGWIFPSPSDPISPYIKRLSPVKTTDGLIFHNQPGHTRKRLTLRAAKDTEKPHKNRNQRQSKTVPQSVKAAANPCTSLKDAIPPSTANLKQTTLEIHIYELLERGQTHAALEKIELHHRRFPLSLEAYLLQAFIYWQQKQISWALNSLEKAIYLDPDSPMAFYLSGLLLQKQGSLGQAKSHLLRAKSLLEQLDDKHTLPLSQLGTVNELLSAVKAKLSAIDKLSVD
jgi:chemotaxis protein methyltransferase CheR